MMNLSPTNEEMEVLRYFLGEGNKAMNQLLVSNAETDIALLIDNADNETFSISYDREMMISNLMKIKALYTLILKQYYKNNKRTTEFFRGTNLAEVERVKNEPFIDKFISATKSLESAENNFASNWNKPTCINIKLESTIPYLIVKDVLEEGTDEVLIAPFTKVKKIELFEEKQLDNTSRDINVYNIELEKQELQELADRERFGLYSYILDNAYLVERKLKECINLDKENEINYENIRKLEQLLIKYENSVEDKEMDTEYLDISSETDYDNIDRINKELDELKETTTRIFEARRENINFINNWKRNIAVYMIAECNEIEKKFLDFEVPEQIEENKEASNVIELSQDQEENSTITAEENNNSTLEENNNLNTNNDVDENKDTDPKSNQETKVSVDDFEESNPILKRVRNESRENIEASEELIKNIKLLITKQQNHARIARNIGSNYSALNNAFEMRNVAEDMLVLLQKVDTKIQDAKNDEEKLESISKINIEISTLLNYLNNPKIALRNTSVTRFEEMAIIEENELKRGIAQKIREIRGEAELKKLKDDLEIIEDKTNLSKFIGLFTGQNKLDDFMIEQIEIRQKAIRKNLSKKLNLAYNYSVHELMAEIELFIEDNEDDVLVEEHVLDLKEIAEELRRNYIISESKVHSIAQKKSGKNLPINSKKVSRFEMIEIETYRFLNKYGYDIELKNDEPKYQNTMASEISRIVEYINSSKIL